MKNFETTSGLVVVGDPCFEKNQKELIVLEKIKKGKWSCEADLDEKVYGSTINKLTMEYSKKETENMGVMDNFDFQKVIAMMCNKDENELKSFKKTFKVESGQAGVFDYKYYRNDKSVSEISRISDKIVCEEQPWYSICCDRSLSENNWGVFPYGCVGSISLGNGEFEVEYFKNVAEEIVKIEINFSSFSKKESDDN